MGAELAGYPNDRYGLRREQEAIDGAFGCRLLPSLVLENIAHHVRSASALFVFRPGFRSPKGVDDSPDGAPAPQEPGRPESVQVDAAEDMSARIRS